jgi:hypothetical protein
MGHPFYHLFLEHEMNTSELTGQKLNAAVAKCEGIETYVQIGDYDDGGLLYFVDSYTGQEMSWSPSTDWSDAGPIIERDGIEVCRLDNGEWRAQLNAKGCGPYCRRYGPTPLIAAMRCVVASKLGEGMPDDL